jgi:hypothetical protein
MPVYMYEVIKTGEIIEIEQPISERDAATHPETGEPIRRVYTAPNIGGKYSEGATKNLLSDDNLKKTGFTKYVRDPVTRRYNRTVGEMGPSQLRPHG